MFKQKHFVTFHSPGTFFSEENREEIEGWDIGLACEKAKSIKQRYNATPFGFSFETIKYVVSHDEDGNEYLVNPKTEKKSGTYFLTGRLITIDDIPENDKERSILRSNMECNDWPIVIENTNSYRSTQPFRENDFIVDFDGNELRNGNEPALVQYRKTKIKEHRDKMKTLYG